MRTLPFDHEVATPATDLSIAPRKVRDHSPARGLPARNGLRAPWTRLGPTNRSRAIALHTNRPHMYSAARRNAPTPRNARILHRARSPQTNIAPAQPARPAHSHSYNPSRLPLPSHEH